MRATRSSSFWPAPARSTARIPSRSGPRTTTSCSARRRTLRWSYGASKAIDEFLALAYRRQHRLPVVVGRFFNVVGPRQTGRYGMVLPRFVDAALAGVPLVVHDDGQQVRCFAHVTDVVPDGRRADGRTARRSAGCSTSAATSRCRSWNWPSA